MTWRRRTPPMGRRPTLPPGRQAAPLGLRSLSARNPDTGERIYLGEVDPFLVSVPTVSLIANATASPSVRFNSRSGLLIRSIRATSTGAFSIQFVNDFDGDAWQDRPLLGSLVTGTGQNPYDLPVPALVRSDNALNLTIADLSGGANVIDITFDCCRLSGKHVGDAELALLERERPYFQSCSLVIPALAGSRSLETKVITPTKAGVDYELWDLQAQTRTNWYAEFRAKSEATLWQSDKVRAENLFGDGQFPGRLLASVDVAGNETVTIVGTNAAAGAITTEIVLGGTKAAK